MSVDPLIANMRAIDLLERQAKIPFTVLTRGEGSDGTWHQIEVSRIINRLMTEAYQLPAKPQHVILFGEFTKNQVLKAMGGGCTFTAEVVVGVRNERLPFVPPGF